MTMKDGIKVGDVKDTLVKLDVQFDKCGMDNSIEGNQTLLSFNANMEATLNFTMQDTVFFLFGNSFKLKNVKLVDSKVEVNKTRDFEVIFESIFANEIEVWNTKHKDGVPLGALDPQLAMIGGLLKNTTMSTAVADGWLYAGFDMAADAPYYRDFVPTPKEELPVLEFLQ